PRHCSPTAILGHRRHQAAPPATRPVGFEPPSPQQPFPTIFDVSHRRNPPEKARNRTGFDRISPASFSVIQPPFLAIQGRLCRNFGKKSRALTPFLKKEAIFLGSEPGMGVMPRSPQDSSWILGNSRRVLS
ncbi:unnamed protein product, partial [Prunus brigantina]